MEAATNNLDVGFRNGSIRLEQIPTVYYSGQTINGSVVFDLREPLDFNALYIQFVGQAKVFWTETETETIHGHSNIRVVGYRANEEYFNYTQTLAGGTGITQLPKTHHAIPFKFQIPFNVPSSFEGEKGSISYSITATMVNANMSKEELTKEFTVIAPLDLNTGNPSIKAPTDLEFEEVYSCCCSSNPVNIHIQLPVTGYCPGQTIPVAVHVENASNVEITKMIFEILTKELYRSRQPQSEYILPEKILATSKRGAVMAHSKRNFTCELVVPDMIVPNLENCSLIDVGYFFRVTIKLSGCNEDLQDEAEICLGLVPVKEILQEEYKHPMAHSLPTCPIPINDGSVPDATPVLSPTFTGSTASLHRSQTNLTQTYPTQNCPPPYPGNNALYASENRSQFGSSYSINKIQTSTQSTHLDCPPPYSSYASYYVENTVQITVPVQPPYGFKTPTGPVPTINLPYPTSNQTYPSNMPTPQVGFAPSAPPTE